MDKLIASGRQASWQQICLATLVVGTGYAFSRRDELQDWIFSKLWSAMSENNAKRVAEFRKPLWTQAQGNVLEVGIGHGETLMLLPRAQAADDSEKPGKLEGITSYVALEPNAFLHPKLAENAAKAGFTVRYDPDTCPDAVASDGDTDGQPKLTIVNGTLDGGPDNIPAYISEHGPYDCIMISMVLCSVSNQRANLQAIQKLLVPGGKYFFIEHVRHTDSCDTNVNSQYVPGSLSLPVWKVLQTLFTPVFKLAAGNCHMNRETGNIIRSMDGWSQVEISTHRGVDTPLTKLTPLIYGFAIKQ